MTQSTRISRDEALMENALTWSRRGTCLRKQVGAVIALESRVISTGYVGAPAGLPHCDEHNCSQDRPCNRTVHAEANAIAFAARKGIATEGATLYTTLSPCEPCARLIINAGITELVFLDRYRDPAGLILLCEALVRVRHLIKGSYPWPV